MLRRELSHVPAVEFGSRLHGTDHMNRNILFLIIGALIVGVGVLGYQLYQERQKPGLSISIGGKEGLKIEGSGK